MLWFQLMLGLICALFALAWIWTDGENPMEAGPCSLSDDIGNLSPYQWRRYDQSEWREFPPGRICRVYAATTAAQQRQLATRGYLRK